jgi:flagellar basal-body rod modification protein FlgD
MTITATQATTPANSGATAGATSQLTADFSMFLKLLTTQMQNQDPLNPMDTAQYTQQLVQYSQVEQSIKQNTTLSDILARLSSQDLTQSSSLIGREARFDSAVSPLGKDGASWAWTSDRTLASLEASVIDASGAVVATQVIDPAKSGTFQWNGALSNGGTATEGSYTLALKGVDASGNAATLSIQGMAIVDGVTVSNGVTMLTANGATYPASAVVGLQRRD